MYELRPGAYESDGWFLRTPEVMIDIGPDGCRRTPGNPRPRQPTVLFMGDSMTFGLGVGDSDTFPARVGEILRRDLDPTTAIANRAVPGYNLGQSVRAIEVRLETMRPEIVALVVHPADLENPIDFSSLAPASPDLRQILATSRLARLVYILYRVATLQHDRTTPSAFIDTGALDAYLGRLEKVTRAVGATPVVLTLGNTLHPSLSFGEILSSHGLRSHEIRALARDQGYYLADGEHWTVEGNLVVATRVAAILESSLADRDTAPPPPPGES